MKYDYLFVGSAVVDIIASTDTLKRVKVSTKEKYKTYLPLASKTNLQDLEVNLGGSALNVAVTVSHLGGNSLLLSSVGKDLLGNFILNELKDTKINTKYFKRVRTHTGIGLNILSKGEKSGLVYHGAVEDLGPLDITPKIIQSVKRILITSITSKKNFALFLRILKLAKKYNVPVIFAPSMTMLHLFQKKLKRLHYPFEIVILNYEESQFLTGKKNIKDILNALPGKVKVVTKDKDGAYAQKEKTFHINIIPVKVKSTTGAGDVFCGSFVHTYFKTKSLQEALTTATMVASMKLTHLEAEVVCSPRKISQFKKRYKRRLHIVEV